MPDYPAKAVKTCKPAAAAFGPQICQMFGAVMGMRVFGKPVRMVAGRGAKKVEVDAVHGLRPVAKIASWECHKTCDNPNQEIPWEES